MPMTTIADSYISMEKKWTGHWEASAISLYCLNQERIPIECRYIVFLAQTENKMVVDSGFFR